MAEPITQTELDRELALFEGLEAIALDRFERGRFRVDADGGRFDCVLSRGGDRLFVLLAGGIRRRRQGLPHFQRWRWAQDFPGSVLLVADPTLRLADRLGLGWYLGPAEANWTVTLARLVGRVAEELGIAPEDIVFYGSSSGGFAAITAASWSPGAGAIGINPQTDVLRYHPRAVKRMLKTCFPGTSMRNFPERLRRERLLAWARCEASPQTRVLIAQNSRDRVHLQRHFTPFCERLGIPPDGGISPSRLRASLLFENDAGHVGAEPKELLPELLRRYDMLGRPPRNGA